MRGPREDGTQKMVGRSCGGEEDQGKGKRYSGREVRRKMGGVGACGDRQRQAETETVKAVVQARNTHDTPSRAPTAVSCRPFSGTSLVVHASAVDIIKCPFHGQRLIRLLTISGRRDLL